ncbi:hypothetical protein DPMN_084960 [Dreissena polymorpha]|uniref:Uncharacterized protein n=1 Tax=Dreissena polymorpha TaxID=45954 RepID=A0A9D3YFU7_DREPO|nr:hypothetical protein DPMN_084930 [Dreissena polymorpha]KAH3697458.1 hypothetical protein DPMN_084960 [Dreissena polymorpha]
MRNHLLEDILYAEMLNTFKQYQSYLGKKGKDLNGAVELIQNTSIIIDTFRDMRSVIHLEDPRLTQFLEVSNWFNMWNEHSNTCSTGSKVKQQNSNIPLLPML